MVYTEKDRIKIARIIAGALGIHNVEKYNVPDELINLGLKKARTATLNKETLQIINYMLQAAKDAGIVYNSSIVKLLQVESFNPEDNKISDEIDNLTDDDLDDMVKHIKDIDLDSYDDNELHITDEDGNHVSEISDLKEDTSYITEVLSRVERIKLAMRFKQGSSKRHRKLVLALHTKSTPVKMNRRARHSAILLMTLKFAGKPLDQLSVSDKERIERILAKKKDAINRLAMKLIPHLRQLENKRLHPKKKDNK